MNTKTIVIVVALLAVVIAGIATTVFLVRRNQTVTTQAQTTGDPASSCQLPDPVTNVQIDYPNCQ